MKKIIYLILLVVFVNANAQVVIPNKDISASDIISLNGKWKFKYIPSVNIGADSGFYDLLFNFEVWNEIRVPGHWELQGFAEPNYKKVDEGTGLYVTSFSLPENWKEKQLYIVFDGVQYGYDFWINGKYVGTGASSYNRQMFDVTEFVTYEKRNGLAVKVTTRNKGYEFDLNDCWGLSGIYRDVNILAVPRTHIKDFFVKTYLNDNSAEIDLSVDIEKNMEDVSVAGKIYSPDEKIVKEFTTKDETLLAKGTTKIVIDNIVVDNPLLWTAETPWLYKLELTLSSNGKEIQKINQKIGIRQVTIENGVLKLNGKKIKLRGVNWHNLDPVVGRSLTEEMILKDLDLIKKANMNFVRTSHYPPHHRMIELCDSLGLYVMCEVPFGYGDKHLADSSYLEILINRAEATLWRDKNHPSIIIWSIGNENPYTDICDKTGKFVKKMDNTRPVCFPQVGSYFRENHETFADSLELLTPHYFNADEVESYQKIYNKPMIITEYAHALGLDFDKTESIVDEFYKHDRVAGGAVWHLFDQGILKESDFAVDKNSFTTSVWLDSVHYYDNFDNMGADGLVYANRIPQTDYWQIRKVYSPVQALDDSIYVNPGKQDVIIKIANFFDFTNLSDVKCIWVLSADKKSVQAGNIIMKGLPHDTVSLPITLNIPQDLSAKYYLLTLKFYDKDNYQFNEKKYRLWHNDNPVIENKDLVSENRKGSVIKDDKNVMTLKTDKALFIIDKKGSFIVENTASKQKIINGPFARVGRKTTMSSLITNASRTKDNGYYYWDPYMLKDPVSSVEEVSDNVVKCNYKYKRSDTIAEFIEGYITYTFSNNGWVDVEYNFTPVNATGIFLEAGISFEVSSDYSEMRWIGDGPYPSYPGKSKLNEFGFYHLNSEDLNYQGNRSNVDMMLFTDKNGNGFAVNCKNANIAVEKNKDGIIVSHNAIVSGRYNKKQFPHVLSEAGKVEKIEGSFSILPIYNEEIPQIIKELFGEMNKTATPFKPFYHSYDQ